MKAKKVVLLTALVLFVAASALEATATDQQKNFYNACLDWKISKCEAKSSVSNSSSASLIHYAEVNHRQAEFYENNREALIQEMIRQNLALKRQAVEHFLINIFFNGYPHEELVSR